MDTGLRRYDTEGNGGSGGLNEGRIYRGALLGRRGDDQLAVVIDREPSLARRLDDAGMPVDLAGVGSADHGDQRRLGILARVAEPAIDPDRHVDDVARLQRDRALDRAFQPED